jgi:hypothetical protein
MERCDGGAGVWQEAVEYYVTGTVIVSTGLNRDEMGQSYWKSHTRREIFFGLIKKLLRWAAHVMRMEESDPVKKKKSFVLNQEEVETRRGRPKLRRCDELRGGRRTGWVQKLEN